MSLNFLLEIGTEEIPAAYLKPYSQQLEKLFKDAVTKLNLSLQQCSTVYTPRRLTLFVSGLTAAQPKVDQEIKGPPAAIAFKDGHPTKAAEAFARKTKLDLADIETKVFGDKEYLFAQVTTGGIATKDLLPSVTADIIRKLRSPKSMHWEDKPTTFARPIRWIVALLEKDLIEVDLDGLKSDRITYGHRFIAPESITIDDANKENYLKKLAQAFVIPNIADREQILIDLLIKAGGSKEKLDYDLVTTCANLVEWPQVVRGNFSEEFLELPEAVLVTSLKKHQKSFPVYSEDGNLSAGFLSVANNDLDNPDLIRNGYERVIIARLADAKFFWDEDLKKTLANRVEELKTMTFQQKLGSYYDKAERVQNLIAVLAEKTNNIDTMAIATKAALLSRTDLLTAMVYEFPELQGTMGTIYAQQVDQESASVANAISEMYLPRSADDQLPPSMAGALLSVADKIDTIVGCCSVGFAPTGSADPYALRRQAIGVLKIIVDKNLNCSLLELVNASIDMLQIEDKNELLKLVVKLFKGRFETILKDSGVRYDIVNAILKENWDEIAKNWDKAQQIMDLVNTESFKVTCTLVERCHNISKKAEIKQDKVEPNLFIEDSEKTTWASWMSMQTELDRILLENDYAQAIELLAQDLAPNLNQYFEEVLVNVEDQKVCLNRCKMLNTISQTVKTKLADLSEIVSEN